MIPQTGLSPFLMVFGLLWLGGAGFFWVTAQTKAAEQLYFNLVVVGLGLVAAGALGTTLSGTVLGELTVESFSIVGVVSLVWNLLIGLGWLGLVLILGLLSLVMMYGEYSIGKERDDGSEIGIVAAAPTISSVIKGSMVALAVFMAWRIYTDAGSVLDVILGYWFLIPMFLSGYLMFIYSQNRRKYASTETTLRNMRRQVRRDAEGWSSAIVGTVALGIALAAGVLAGAMGQLGALGEVGSMFVGEVGFLLTTYLGYAALGGEKAPFSLELSPLAFVGVALFIGGIALIIRET